VERAKIHTFLATVWYVVPIIIGIYIDFLFGLPKISFAFDYFFGIFLIILGAFVIYRGTADLIKYGKGSPHPYFPPKKFVKEGIYKKIRHPIYFGWILLTFGSAFYFQSISILEAAFMIIIFLYFYVNAEEKNLEKVFGKKYIEYKKKVPSFIPKF
jgi:protein-S-isoprenylcysteine O-methyltransferase Ste14